MEVAYAGSGFAEVSNGSGTFQAGESITSSTKSATFSGVEKLEDVIITHSTGATRRVQGTDYSIDPDSGYVQKLSGGGLLDADKGSYDYEALDKRYVWGMSGGSVTDRDPGIGDGSFVGEAEITDSLIIRAGTGGRTRDATPSSSRWTRETAA
ncbi:MAG: hypothetical protein AB9873_07820 [Syntrophobacteraceae bacterium]